MFFEFRHYCTLPGQRERWARFMEEEIIPFQISKGMVVIGSFVGEQEDDLYVWIRRFDSEEQREALYAAVYQSDHWKNVLAPKSARCSTARRSSSRGLCQRRGR